MASSQADMPYPPPSEQSRTRARRATRRSTQSRAAAGRWLAGVAAAVALASACESAEHATLGNALVLAIDSTLAANGVCADAGTCYQERHALWHGGVGRRVHVDVRGVTDPAAVTEVERCARRVLAARPGWDAKLAFYRDFSAYGPAYGPGAPARPFRRVRIPDA